MVLNTMFFPAPYYLGFNYHIYIIRLFLPTRDNRAFTYRREELEPDDFLFFQELYLSFNITLRRSQNAKRTPQNPKPMNISHEPGLKGVISAAKPIIISNTPATLIAGESL